MHASREEYRKFHEWRYAALLDVLNRHVPQALERGLDVGGGGDAAGFGASLRGRFVRELHAIDQGEDVARGAAQAIPTKACDIDREPLPYPDSYFDLILFASVIEHLYHPWRAMDEFTRTLKPGGLLLIEAPNALSLGRRLDALLGRNPFRWFNQYNAAERGAPMIYCSVFYSAEEVAGLLTPDYQIVDTVYGMHQPNMNVVKRLLRHAASAINPKLSDFFAVVARRNV